MGLMPEQFYAMTWNQYCIRCRGFFAKEKKEWERVGWATYNSISVHVGKKMPSYKKFLSFLYEDDFDVSQLDQIKAIMNKKTAEYLKNHGRN